MILEPKAVVLYVTDIPRSSKFYQDLLGIQTIESSPSFHSFRLSNGMVLGLKAKDSVVPQAEVNGSGELVFILDTPKEVDALFSSWQKKEIKMALQPVDLSFGYSFQALDPDGNRLRVVCLKQA